jgi:hypothetical protein
MAGIPIDRYRTLSGPNAPPPPREELGPEQGARPSAGEINAQAIQEERERREEESAKELYDSALGAARAVLSGTWNADVDGFLSLLEKCRGLFIDKAFSDLDKAVNLTRRPASTEPKALIGWLALNATLFAPVLTAVAAVGPLQQHGESDGGR